MKVAATRTPSTKFTKTSIDETNKIHQKVIGLKFMFKMSTTTIQKNTCTQMTTPLHNGEKRKKKVQR